MTTTVIIISEPQASPSQCPRDHAFECAHRSWPQPSPCWGGMVCMCGQSQGIHQGWKRLRPDPPQYMQTEGQSYRYLLGEGLSVTVVCSSKCNKI